MSGESWLFLGTVVSTIAAIIIALINKYGGKKEAPKGDESPDIQQKQDPYMYVQKHIDYLVHQVQTLDQELQGKRTLEVDYERVRGQLVATREDLRDAYRELQYAKEQARVREQEYAAHREKCEETIRTLRGRIARIQAQVDRGFTNERD